jgi:hypothetical protein
VRWGRKEAARLGDRWHGHWFRLQLRQRLKGPFVCQPWDGGVLSRVYFHAVDVEIRRFRQPVRDGQLRFAKAKDSFDRRLQAMMQMPLGLPVMKAMMPMFRSAAEMRRIKDAANINAAAPALPAPEPVKHTVSAPKSRIWRDADHFIDKLQARGYQVLGRGCFSTVLAKPGSEKVIKVNTQADNWPDFVLWAAKAGYAGTFAPRLFSLRYINGVQQEFYVAVVERLDATVRDTRNDRVRNLHSLLRNVLEAGRIERDRARADEQLIEADKMQPGAARFVLEFRLHAEKGGHGRLDLHNENWMYHQGRIVLVDPFCSGDRLSDSAKRRYRSRDLAALSAS